MRVFFLFIQLSIVSASFNWDDLQLDQRHLKYFIQSNNEFYEKCKADSNCPVEIEERRCWGHEKNCSYANSYSSEHGLPFCEKGHEAKKELFWKQADWGYVKQRAELFSICSSKTEKGSSLNCSRELQYCYGKNLFFDFRHFVVERSARYRNDIILKGDVGGNCDKFDQILLNGNLNQRSYLQSWGHELEHFASIPSFQVDESHCDITFDGPIILQKQDAAVNLYHHFCDFVNLYVSQHINGSFNRDPQVIWWDTAATGFGDGFFGAAWGAFSKKKPIELISLAGKRVCFKDVMFSLLARQPFGLYYNMPVTPFCAGSGLIHAFSRHFLHRLDIAESLPVLETVRVTILSRSTAHRRILNIEELSSAVRSLPGVHLRVLDYNHEISFLNQLRSTHSSDIFIGIHGAGLTHLLFLPDWAVIFELYHCEDRGCYRDLARLRGVKYFTWPDEKLHLITPDKIGEKEKFVNYTFGAQEFMAQVQKMVEWVRRHPKFVEARRKLRRKLKAQEL